MGISSNTRAEIIRKLEAKKSEIANQIANLSESSKDTTKRISILIDFANRIPELYLKATLEEKRMILNTITERILIDKTEGIVKVRLRPVFEYLRQMKLQNKQTFSADLKTLGGTLETRSEKAKLALKDIRPNFDDFVDFGTRKEQMQTKKEPHRKGSKKLNVVGGT